MSANSKIEWTDHTFNPWAGCTKISPGCDHCYAESWAKRSGMVKWGAGTPRRRTTPANWAQVAKWDASAGKLGKRAKVFCASLADVFDNEVPSEWRMDLANLIASTENIDWLLLTKRIGNVMPMCGRDSILFDVIVTKVWLGISLVNQDEAERDIPKLLAVPAKRIFLSCEPLLAEINLRQLRGHNGCTPISYDALSGSSSNTTWGIIKDKLPDRFGFGKVDWVIAGGESGPGARPMHPDWARSLRNQCQAAGAPFFFKQWGDWVHELQPEAPASLPAKEKRFEWPDGFMSVRVGKKAAGRILDGRPHDEYPS